MKITMEGTPDELKEVVGFGAVKQQHAAVKPKQVQLPRSTVEAHELSSTEPVRVKTSQRRKRHAHFGGNRNKVWSVEAEAELVRKRDAGESSAALAKYFGRTKKGVMMRYGLLKNLSAKMHNHTVVGSEKKKFSSAKMRDDWRKNIAAGMQRYHRLKKQERLRRATNGNMTVI